MDNMPNPLEYHYRVGIKLDYWILSADVALLGWTIVNTDWLPNGQVHVLLIGVFWFLIALSIVCGIARQLLNGVVFGLNHQFLESSSRANEIERAATQGGEFKNRETGEVISSEDFKKMAPPHRKKEKKGRDLYDKESNKSAFFAGASLVFFVIALFLLAIIKLSALL